MSSTAAFLAPLRRALFAQDCVLCAAASGDSLVCTDCAVGLPQLASACPQCAEPSPDNHLCGACLVESPAFDRTIAAWRYAFPLDRLVQALKYGGRLALADWFGSTLATRIGLPTVDLIIPLPLHERRLRTRGFNQAVEIARRIARLHRRRLITDALVRVRDTPAQMALPHDARSRNVRDAFACTASLAGARIALVDDVMTTGATLNEAARALKHAGAVHVENWVVARATSREASF